MPLYWTELTNRFLKFPNHDICVVITDKRVNRDIGLGLEIPVDYFFHGDNRFIEWFKKSIEKLDVCTDVKVEICMIKPVYLLKSFKITHLFYYCFLIYPKFSASAIEK